ncbi:MAG: hypothetical protein H6734_15290 [Alphaproteobacteria bacterium]|nr:hypothetical protein [Alphaproteobacteria bacterium]
MMLAFVLACGAPDCPAVARHVDQTPSDSVTRQGVWPIVEGFERAATPFCLAEVVVVEDAVPAAWREDDGWHVAGGLNGEELLEPLCDALLEETGALRDDDLLDAVADWGGTPEEILRARCIQGPPPDDLQAIRVGSRCPIVRDPATDAVRDTLFPGARADVRGGLVLTEGATAPASGWVTSAGILSCERRTCEIHGPDGLLASHELPDGTWGLDATSTHLLVGGEREKRLDVLGWTGGQRAVLGDWQSPRMVGPYLLDFARDPLRWARVDTGEGGTLDLPAAWITGAVDDGGGLIVGVTTSRALQPEAELTDFSALLRVRPETGEITEIRRWRWSMGEPMVLPLGRGPEGELLVTVRVGGLRDLVGRLQPDGSLLVADAPCATAFVAAGHVLSIGVNGRTWWSL